MINLQEFWIKLYVLNLHSTTNCGIGLTTTTILLFIPSWCNFLTNNPGVCVLTPVIQITQSKYLPPHSTTNPKRFNPLFSTTEILKFWLFWKFWFFFYIFEIFVWSQIFLHLALSLTVSEISANLSFMNLFLPFFKKAIFE